MEIIQLIQTLESLQNDLQKVSLSAVEKDILLKKMAALYENLLLKKTAIIAEQTPVNEVVESTKIETLIVSEEPVGTKNLLPEAQTEIAENTAEKVEISNTAIEEKKSSPEEKPETKHTTNLLELKAEKPLLNERFQQNSVGLNERIQQGDLKKAIDFNRQFVFIQELFANDAIAYMKTIERINEMTKLEEAIAYLNSDVIHQYKWKPESQSVKLFEKIVHQKFGI